MLSLGLDCATPLFLFVSLVVLPIASSTDNIRLNSNDKTVALFVFGDSVYDPGNNDYLNITSGFKANFPPYGETFFHYPTGRFCDGRLIPDFIAMHAGLPVWEPYLQPGIHNFTDGANFASAGAGVLPFTQPLTLNLGIQLSFLKEVASLLRKEVGDTEVNELLRNAVYLTSIGGVDYMGSEVYDATESEQRELVEMVVGNLTDIVTEIYEMGGRKFVFQNVGPLGCAPEAKQVYNLSSDDCAEAFTAIASLHNDALINATKELEIKLPGFHYSIFDYYTSLYDRIKNPSKYEYFDKNWNVREPGITSEYNPAAAKLLKVYLLPGFKEANVACCGSGIYRGTDCGIGEYELCSDPNEYLFFDGDHICESANSQLAELMWNGGTDVTSPINMRQLYELDLEIETSTDG